jgi:hypothetical protein
MADTGFNWDDAWTTLQNAVTLTTGGTTTNASTAVNNDGKADCVVTVTATYSNHAKATAGLSVYILADVDGTNYEAIADGAWGIEMVFTQNSTNRISIPVPASKYPAFKVYLSWGNTTSSSNVSVTTRYKQATIPVAS